MESKSNRPTLMMVISLISFAILSALWSTSGALAQSKSESCHLRELDLCAATLLMFTQAPGGMATTEQEINKQCVHLKDSDTCLRNYTKRCMTPMQRDVISFASNSSFQMLNDYCTKGSQLRQGYLKHATCLNQVQKKEQKSCIKDFQVSLELLTGGGSSAAAASGDNKRFQLGCCTYNKFENCLSSSIEKRCGKEALSFVNGIVHKITSRLPETVCRSYKPDSTECKALLPKPGTSPKGSKSNSIFSRLLSAYTGF